MSIKYYPWNQFHKKTLSQEIFHWDKINSNILGLTKDECGLYSNQYLQIKNRQRYSGDFKEFQVQRQYLFQQRFLFTDLCYHFTYRHLIFLAVLPFTKTSPNIQTMSTKGGGGLAWFEISAVQKRGSMVLMVTTVLRMKEPILTVDKGTFTNIREGSLCHFLRSKTKEGKITRLSSSLKTFACMKPYIQHNRSPLCSSNILWNFSVGEL